MVTQNYSFVINSATYGILLSTMHLTTNDITEVIQKNIVIIYHGFCTDGFGSAYAAWKKFGDDAVYIPQERTNKPFDIEILRDKEVYVLDYSFSQEVMLTCQAVAKSFTVIDHHVSAEQSVRSLNNHIFDINHSGAYLSWQYFHPNTVVPKLIEYISDSDTWAHALENWREVEAFIYSDNEQRFTFSYFDDLDKTLETSTGMELAIKVGSMLVSSFNNKVARYLELAELIDFDGQRVYAVNAPNEIKSELGHILATKTNSFAVIFNYQKGYWKCSLRSVDDCDVSIIAEKYGGGGHKNAAAFLIPTDFPLPLAH